MSEADERYGALLKELEEAGADKAVLFELDEVVGRRLSEVELDPETVKELPLYLALGISEAEGIAVEDMLWELHTTMQHRLDVMNGLVDRVSRDQKLRAERRGR